jgi:hypothetical protein
MHREVHFHSRLATPSCVLRVAKQSYEVGLKFGAIHYLLYWWYQLIYSHTLPIILMISVYTPVSVHATPFQTTSPWKTIIWIQRSKAPNTMYFDLWALGLHQSRWSSCSESWISRQPKFRLVKAVDLNDQHIAHVVQRKLL